MAQLLSVTGSLFVGQTALRRRRSQEYNGKRVFVVIEDNTGHSFRSKIDLGVHKQMSIGQDEYCFDVCLDDVGQVSWSTQRSRFSPKS